MNWIEVTKDTKIKCGTKVLIKTTYGQFIVAKVTDFDNVLLLSDCKDSGTYGIHDYTHYCVITEPESPTELIKELEGTLSKLTQKFSRDSEQELKCLRIQSNVISLGHLLNDD